eukprot:TRINITY_DN3404_c0_g2_i4.p1 TRINITY_DN3404_c0_g2~~TRINITY_DN3404_c0_g2_i4.p1  ORF type:complete len:580 (-),score=30.24 TRINITY_DN3404_c0_g2_i4:374-2068(-)
MSTEAEEPALFEDFASSFLQIGSHASSSEFSSSPSRGDAFLTDSSMDDFMDTSDGLVMPAIAKIETSAKPSLLASSTDSHLVGSGYSLKILGIPEKCRVEKQIKLCLQLKDHAEHPIKDWSSLILPDPFVADSKKHKEGYTKAGRRLRLEAQILFADDSGAYQRAHRCLSCIQREQRSLDRWRKRQQLPSTPPSSVEEEKKKILLFYTSSPVNFTSGEAIIPIRITCYCSHHHEREGFRVHITLVDELTNQPIVSALSVPVMIQDDHKKANKRKKSASDDPPVVVAHEETLPVIKKAIPAEGPCAGGIEVTLLGENMNPHLHAAFGGVEAVETKFWGSSTLLAILPPSIRPGPVMVSFTNSKLLTTDTDKPIIFTYKDESEKSLMELALQIVGIKLTGTVNDARLIAQSIINSSKYQTGTTKPTSAPRGSTTTTLQQRLLLSLRKLEHLPTEYPIQLFHKNGLGQTLLHLAARKGFLQLIRFLLPKATPAEINGRDNFGYTALHYACWAGQQNTVDSLMNHGAHVDLLSNSGITAMKLAEAGGFAKVFLNMFQNILIDGRLSRD